MNSFFHQLSSALEDGPVALATVVAARGSTPRVAGARQFLTCSGRSEGTIGGGVAESRVLELARATLTDGQWRTYEVDMRGRPGEVRDGVCGGLMTIWIVRLEGPSIRETMCSLTQSLDQGKSLLLSLRPDQEQPIAILSSREVDEADGKSLTELIEPPPRLLIVGAGHIGRSLAHVIHRLGFVTAVQDERPEWLSAEAFPADCELESDLARAGRVLGEWEGGRFIAMVTRGFGQDVDALKILGDMPALDYLGILGSKARLATVFAAGREAGAIDVLPPFLHAPIGIEIGAETPEEIAVSIAAEIIQVWRSGRGGGPRSGS